MSTQQTYATRFTSHRWVIIIPVFLDIKTIHGDPATPYTTEGIPYFRSRLSIPPVTKP